MHRPAKAAAIRDDVSVGMNSTLLPWPWFVVATWRSDKDLFFGMQQIPKKIIPFGSMIKLKVNRVFFYKKITFWSSFPYSFTFPPFFHFSLIYPLVLPLLFGNVWICPTKPVTETCRSCLPAHPRQPKGPGSCL